MESRRVGLVVFLLVSLTAPSIQQGQRPPFGGFGPHGGSHGSPEVTTSNGKVRGTTMQLDSNLLMDMFKGIPYAQPPVGALRLKPPQPPASWTDVKDVSNDNTACAQGSPMRNGESEDCLKLDLYRPQNVSQPLPVMVFIHGGGYAHGSKNGANGRLLVNQGVILVSINYRLGPLGFLSTGDDSMPGNYGMLDQIAALKWVQGNIAAFGGDPNSVTIFGQSAGSGSVSLHLFSPLSKGLFHKAIMQSGIASTSRDVPPPKRQVTLRDVAMATGNTLGCGQTPGAAFLACLQNKDISDFLKASIDAAHADHSSGPFRPRIETVFGFLPDYPLRMRARGEMHDVPTMRGFNAQENGMGIHDPQNDGLTVHEFEQTAQRQLNDFPYLDANTYTQKLKDLYLTNVTDPLVVRAKAIQLLSEFTYILPMVRETQEQRRHQKSHSYLYKFNYSPSWSRNQDWQGVTHGTESGFLFGAPPHQTASDQAVFQIVQTLWTNFAKFGDPTPIGHLHDTPAHLVHWNQFWNNSPNYLVIEDPVHMATYNTTEDQKNLAFYKETEKEYLMALGSDTIVVG